MNSLLKKVLLVGLLVMLAVSTNLLAQFAGGSGTEEEPYLVATAEHLYNVRHHVNSAKYFKQIADIDLDIAPYNEGEGWEPIGGSSHFTGSYDGQGYIIDNLYINRPDENNIGLFSGLSSAEISNIGLENVNVTGNNYVAALVGRTNNASPILNCYITGNISGNTIVGAFVSDVYGVISNSYYNYDSVLINGENIITIGALKEEQFNEWLSNGRVLDINDYLEFDGESYLISTMEDLEQLLAFGWNSEYSYKMTNNIDLESKPNFYIPYFSGKFDGQGYEIENLIINVPTFNNIGFFGYIYGGEIINLGIKNANITGHDFVGVFSGYNQYCTISNCFAKDGSITGGSYVGGFVGVLDATTYNSIDNSYSTVNVSGNGTYIEGFCGYSSGTVTNSYWNTETSGQSTSAGGEGRTTEEMTYPYAANTYVGWDFDEVWQADTDGLVNDGYPYLYTDTPDIVVTPDNIAFGEVFATEYADSSFTITNTGTADLTINSIVAPEGFLIEKDSNKNQKIIKKINSNKTGINKNKSLTSNIGEFVLAPADSQVINVRFAPMGITEYSGNIVIDSDDSIVNMAVTGMGMAKLIVTPDSCNISAKADSIDFEVGSNVSWVVNEDIDWLSCTPTNGENSGTFTVSYDANTNLTERTANITITGNDINREVIITQEAGKPVPEIEDIHYEIASNKVIAYVTLNTESKLSYRYGLSMESLENTLDIEEFSCEHVLEIANLESETDYYYEIEMMNTIEVFSVSDIASFKTGKYENTLPLLILDSQTIEYFSTSLQAGNNIILSGVIRDPWGFHNISADMYYRKVGSNDVFQRVFGNIQAKEEIEYTDISVSWELSNLDAPGVELYFEVSDGGSKTLYPSNCAENFFTIAVNTEAPIIVNSNEDISKDQDISFDFDVTDDEIVEYVKLYYRDFGSNEEFTSTNMTLSKGLYTCTLPNSEIGIDYYVVAVDNDSLRTFYGLPYDPKVIIPGYSVNVGWNMLTLPLLMRKVK